MDRATAAPCFSALLKCSTRTRPNSGCSWFATSPAAYTSAALVRQSSSARIPFSCAIDDPVTAGTSGSMPMPATAKSQATR